MITQYTDTYSSVGSDIQNIVANKVSLLEQYIVMQTGQYEYTALVYNPVTKKTTEYTFSRPQSSYSSYYTVSTQTVDTFEFNVSNEYYVYSNVGYGKSLSLPVYDGVVAHSLTFMTVLLSFALIFKGVLFKCLRRRR